MGLDVARYDHSISLTLCGSSGALITCEHLKQSDCRPWRVYIWARVLTTITLACCLVHWHPQTAATCGSNPVISSSTGCLRRDLVRVLRGVYFRFLHFSQLRQDR
jgi:hypothetical protein